MKKISCVFIFICLAFSLFSEDLTLDQMNQKIKELEKRIQLLEMIIISKANSPTDTTITQPQVNQQVHSISDWQNLYEG